MSAMAVLVVAVQLHLVCLRRVHVSTHVPPVSICPAAHTSEWSDDCPSQLGQGILDSNGLRARHAPGDKPCGFEIAKTSGKHALRDASEVAAQLPVSMRPFSKRKQNLGCPPADKDRRGSLRSLHFLHSVLPREMAQLGTYVYLCLTSSRRLSTTGVSSFLALANASRATSRSSRVPVLCVVIVLLSLFLRRSFRSRYDVPLLGRVID